MAALKLYIDIARRVLIQSEANPVPRPELTLVKGNLQPVQLYFVREKESISEPLEAIDYTSAVSLKLRLSTPYCGALEGFWKLGERLLHAQSTVSAIAHAAKIVWKTDFLLVTGAKGSSWFVTFTENGFREIPTLTNLNLYPDSNLSLTVLRAGTASQPALFLLSIAAKPLVETSTWQNVNDVFVGKSGVIDLSGDGVKALVVGQLRATALMSIEVEPSAGQRATVLYQTVGILNNG